MSNFHIPVLLDETTGASRVTAGKKYIDATLGFGGHGFEILKRGGVVLGLDVDKEALDYTTRRWKIESRNWKIPEDNLQVVQGNFKEIDRIAHSHGFDKASGILFDLGVSSHQIDTPERGFSFQNMGPLDMRMDKNMSVSAKELVNGLTQKELGKLFARFGEEPRARIIAAEIVKARQEKTINTTDELVKIAQRAYGFRFSSPKTRASSAKRIFQALRIVVNDELQVLKTAIEKAIRILDLKGRLVIISYHSLEDRIVKDSFTQAQRNREGIVVHKKPIVPGEQEIAQNKRSRSAKLRIFEKTAV